MQRTTQHELITQRVKSGGKVPAENEKCGKGENGGNSAG